VGSKSGLTLGVAPVISGGAELEPFDEIGALREKVRRWLGGKGSCAG
jgi:hypothetical protein